MLMLLSAATNERAFLDRARKAVYVHSETHTGTRDPDNTQERNPDPHITLRVLFSRNEGTSLETV